MKKIILLAFILFSVAINAKEYCISDKIEIRGSAHHVRISNSDDYSIDQSGKYLHIVSVKRPTNQDLKLVVNGTEIYIFSPRANCEDLPIEI